MASAKDVSEILSPTIVLTRGVKKNRETRIGTGTGKPGNRGPGSGSGLKKPETEYPGSGTQFLVPGFYRVTGNRVKYIYIFSFGFTFYKYIYFFTFFFS
jgi:hypothetical protein